MASGAEVIGAAIYHALGYNVVQGYVVDIDPARIVIAPDATTVDMSGRRRPMRRSDVDRLLSRAAKLPNGKYRATAEPVCRRHPARLLQVLRHAARRPQRHPPARASPRAARQPRVRRLAESRRLARPQQPRHARRTRGGPPRHRHYMFDFGSIMGSGSVFAQVPRAGNEYILEWAPALKTLVTLRPVRPPLDPRGLSGGRAVGRPLRRRTSSILPNGALSIRTPHST